MALNWTTTCCDLVDCDNKCPDVCEDLCIDAQVQRGAVQRQVSVRCRYDNMSLIDDAVERNIDVTRHIFCFAIKVRNCTGRTVNNFRPRLDLRCAFVKESNGEIVKNYLDPNAPVFGQSTPETLSCLEGDTEQEVICSLRRLYITSSIGEANDDDQGPGQPGYTGGLQSQPDPDRFDLDPVTNDTSRDGDSTLLKNAVRLPPGESHFNVCVAIDIDNEAPDQVVLLPAIFGFNGQIKCSSGKCMPVHRSVLLACECLPLEGEL